MTAARARDEVARRARQVVGLLLLAGTAELAAAAVVVLALVPWLQPEPLALAAVALALPGARLIRHRVRLLGAFGDPTEFACDLNAAVHTRRIWAAVRILGQVDDVIGPFRPPALALSRVALAAMAALVVLAPIAADPTAWGGR